MTTANEKPQGLDDLTRLVDAGEWDNVNKILTRELAQKAARPGPFEPRGARHAAALDNALIKAVDHDRAETVAMLLVLEDISIETFLTARRDALDKNKRKSLRVMDRYAATLPEGIRFLFNNTYPRHDPRVHERVQAGDLHKARKKRPGQKPRP